MSYAAMALVLGLTMGSNQQGNQVGYQPMPPCTKRERIAYDKELKRLSKQGGSFGIMMTCRP